MADLCVLDRSASADDIFSALTVDGAVVVRDLLDQEVQQAILSDLGVPLEEITSGSKSGIRLWETFHGRFTKRLCGLASLSRTFVDHALLHPVLLEIADRVLLPHAADYWLNTGQIMAVGPGETAQYLHRDENNWPEAVAVDREITVSCMFALDDFTSENGATVVIPGSQHWPTGLVRGGSPPLEEVARAIMRAGSGLIYSGKVVHGAGANRTQTWRHGMHVSFVAGWLRPEEASPLVVDQNLAASLPVRARELLGWGSYHSVEGGRTWLVDFEDVSRLFS